MGLQTKDDDSLNLSVGREAERAKNSLHHWRGRFGKGPKGFICMSSGDTEEKHEPVVRGDGGKDVALQRMRSRLNNCTKRTGTPLPGLGHRKSGWRGRRKIKTVK